MQRTRSRAPVALVLVVAAAGLHGRQRVPGGHSSSPGEGPALGFDRITQVAVESGALSATELRRSGLEVFSTPFNKLDGYGDGPMDPNASLLPGSRPTLQDNGAFLRVNGLDAQSCLECHSVGSHATVPATFTVGGFGGAGSNVLFQPTNIDVSDQGSNGFAAFDGRFINPPFIFGAGGVELLAKEMTVDLQRQLAAAQARPGQRVSLQTKGIAFGSIVVDEAGTLDASLVEGIDEDLVVRPFGRKGARTSVRDFAVDAMQFHFGMQPNEVVGAGVDDDGDGVVNEILAGELSALHVFATQLEAPLVRGAGSRARRGEALFRSAGCAGCHTPALESRTTMLDYAFPEVPADPSANVYHSVDLAESPIGLGRNRDGGLRVPLFSDLKRHDMGPELAESTGAELDAHFITARLWGVADTAPYLHDGRATTLTEAVLAHGGEAQVSRDRFDGLAPNERADLLGFLRTLRTPRRVAADLLASSE